MSEFTVTHTHTHTHRNWLRANSDFNKKHCGSALALSVCSSSSNRLQKCLSFGRLDSVSQHRALQ